MNKPNLLIIAGGLGARMSTYTCNNRIPKLLLSLGNQTILDYIIENYTIFFNRIGIVLSDEEHIKLIENWIATYHKGINIDVLFYPHIDGTFNTFVSIVKNKPEYSKHTLLHWSDIIIKTPDIGKVAAKIREVKNQDNSVNGFVVVDENKHHRMNMIHGQTIQNTSDHTGNIPGIFYMNDWGLLFNYSKKLVNLFDTDISVQLGVMLSDPDSDLLLSHIKLDITDVGDQLKYQSYMETINLTNRFFNHINIVGNEIHKSPRDKKGISLIQNENAFYDVAERYEWPMAHRKNWDNKSNTLVLRRIIGNTINEYINNADPSRTKIDDVLTPIINLFIDGISTIHETKLTENQHSVNHTFLQDLYHEYIFVTTERIDEIKFLLPTIASTNIILNGNFLFVPGFENMIQEFEKMLYDISLFKSGHIHISPVPIHGDPNTSNTMLTENGNIVFIDPRGKFGHSTIVGDPFYDIAKFVYGLHAYDGFNLDKHFVIGWCDSAGMGDCDAGIFRFNMNGYGYDLDTILDLLPYNRLERCYIGVLVGLIFVKLTSYTKNNTNKVIAAYHYGLFLMNKYIDSYRYQLDKQKILCF